MRYPSAKKLQEMDDRIAHFAQENGWNPNFHYAKLVDKGTEGEDEDSNS